MVNKQVIFLTGVGRSGTTLLQGMLNAHSQITFPPETHFFKRYILGYLTNNKLPSVDQLEKDPYLRRLDETTRNAIVNKSYGSKEAFQEAFLQIMQNEDAKVCGDKDTEYVRYLPHLKLLFPQAFFIHIKRDPRDVILSRLKTEWGGKRSLAFHVAEYQYYIKEVIHLGPQLFEGRYLELRYEDLLEDPEKELNKLLRVLNLKFESDMLEFHTSSDRIVAQDELKWKQNLDKPILKNNTGKWKRELSLSKAALVQHQIEDFFLSNNYELVKAKPKGMQVVKKQLIALLFKGKTYKERIR